MVKEPSEASRQAVSEPFLLAAGLVGMNSLDQKILEYAGGDKDLARVFKDTARQLHRVRREAAESSNAAMADVFSFFGISPGRFAYVVRSLREGKDPSEVLRFDELCEYACRHYRHHMPACGGESDSDTNEHAFCEWLRAGYQSWPRLESDEFLDDVADALGLNRFEVC